MTLDASFLNFVSSKWTKYYGREIIIVKQLRKFNPQGEQPSRDKFIYLNKKHELLGYKVLLGSVRG